MVDEKRSSDDNDNSASDTDVDVNIPMLNHVNGEASGVGYFQLTMKGGRRCSSAKAYLSDARGRPNLEIITDAQTEKVIINDGRAMGVRIRRHGQMQTITARAEVILSAGAIGSPQILMLSGLGAS